MSYQACNWALKQRVGSGHLKATLLGMAACYKGRPLSIQEIVAETCRSEATVRRHLNSLSKLGFVSIIGAFAFLNMGEAK